MSNKGTGVANQVAAYLCRNCIPESMSLPAQWTCGGTHVRLKIIPCGGKIDAQYLMHAFESGIGRVCIVTCPEGKCTLSQGNYRAQVRTAAVRQLLAEIGFDPESIRLIRCRGDETPDGVRKMINETLGGRVEPISAVK